MIDYSILKSDILARPELASIIKVGDDAAVAKFYNTSDNTLSKTINKVSVQSLLKWAANGPYAKIVDASNDVNSSVRSICLAAVQVLSSLQDINIKDQTVITMIDVMLSVGIISKEEYDTFNSLDKIVGATPLEVLFGENNSVNHQDIAIALRG